MRTKQAARSMAGVVLVGWLCGVTAADRGGPPPAASPPAAAASQPTTAAADPHARPAGAVTVGGLSFSGMTKLSDGRFFVVHDDKAADAADASSTAPAPRPAPAGGGGPGGPASTCPTAGEPAHPPIGFVTYSVTVKDGKPCAQVWYQRAECADPRLRPNDLEAACLIPGTADEVLAIEGQLRRGSQPRAGNRLLWHLKVRAGSAAVDLVTDPVPLPDLPDEVEGLACAPGPRPAKAAEPPAEVHLLVGLRGGNGRPAELRSMVFARRPAGVRPTTAARPVPLVPPDVGWRATAGPRGCADLLLVPGLVPDGPAELLAVAADDPGDPGPFQSVIYRVGRVADGRLVPAAGPRTIAVLQGLKVEALAAGVVTIAGDGKTRIDCPYTVGTDDEHLGGAWRPIAPPDAR